MGSDKTQIDNLVVPDRTQAGDNKDTLTNPFMEASNYNTQKPEDEEFEGGRKMEKKQTTKPANFMQDNAYFFDYNN